MHAVFIEKRVFKELAVFPSKHVRQIKTRCENLAEYPFPLGSEKLAGSGVPKYRVRQGPYRVIYTVDHAKRVVRVEHVAQRKEVYRNL
jgi:mRNA interferase RelE/StbE